jgi:hypothetical protein
VDSNLLVCYKLENQKYSGSCLMWSLCDKENLITLTEWEQWANDVNLKEWFGTRQTV